MSENLGVQSVWHVVCYALKPFVALRMELSQRADSNPLLLLLNSAAFDRLRRAGDISPLKEKVV